MDNIRKTCIAVAYDVILNALKSNRPRHDPHSDVMIKLVVDVLAASENAFAALDVTESNCRAIFTNVCDKLTKPGIAMHWGRIATMYALAAHLANDVANSSVDETDHYVVEFAEYVGTFVADKTSEWISENGGWKAFDDQFRRLPVYNRILATGILIGIALQRLFVE